jgi:hypothetical protein
MISIVPEAALAGEITAEVIRARVDEVLVSVTNIEKKDEDVTSNVAPLLREKMTLSEDFWNCGGETKA